jgi:hypothetical protein
MQESYHNASIYAESLIAKVTRIKFSQSFDDTSKDFHAVGDCLSSSTSNDSSPHSVIFQAVLLRPKNLTRLRLLVRHIHFPWSFRAPFVS